MINWLTLDALLYSLPRSLIRASQAKLHAATYIFLIFHLTLDQNSAKTLTPCCFTGRTGASKRIENQPSRQRDKPTKILHQVERLNGRMLGADAIVTVRFSGVEE